MAITYTSNKFLRLATSGTEIGVWDVPVNENAGIIDNAFGGVATISLTSASVTRVISSVEAQCVFLRFTGPLGANVAVTLPAVGSFYTVINEATNSSAFYLTMATTAAGGRTIGMPPGTMTDIMTDGTHARFRGLPHVGAYWDHAGSSTPAWVTACTVPPWLYCNGGTFSSATYPQLATIFGSTTLPDHRGRAAYSLNDGTSRILSSVGGVDGNTRFAVGGIQATTLSTVNLPNIAFPVTDGGHSHTATHNAQTGGQTWNGGAGTVPQNNPTATITMNSATTGISVASGGSGQSFAVIPPAVVSGIRLVRAG